MKDVGHDLLDVGWETGPVGLAYLIGALRRQFLVLFLPPPLILGFGLIYLVLAEPLYTATASLRVQVDESGLTERTSVLDTHAELIRSNRITSAVIEELDLDEVLQTSPGRLMQAIDRARTWLNLEAGDSLSAFDEQSSMIRQVQAGLDVQRIGNTSMIDVRYTSPQRSLSIEVANAFATIYVRDLLDQESGALERRADRLQRRAEEVRALASSADEEAQHLQWQSGLMITSTEDMEARIAEVRQQLSVIDAEEDAVRARLSMISQDGMNSLKAAALQSDQTREILGDMTEASSRLDRLRHQAGASEDTVARLEESIAGMRASLEQALSRIRDELELELAMIAARRSGILSQLNELLDYGRSTTWSDLLEAQRKAELYEGIHHNYLNELEEVNRTSADADVALVATARPPTNPSYPQYRVLIVLAITIGIVVGGGIALYREWIRSHAWMPAQRPRPL